MKIRSNFKILMIFLATFVLAILLNCNVVHADTTRVITFKDKNLYKGVVEQIYSRLQSRDEKSLTITIEEQELQWTTSLYLNNYKITDLSGLENFKNLRNLYLNNNSISNLNILENLQELKYLDLSNNEISNLTPLENLSKLDDLLLGYNKITDLKPIAKLVNLETLKLLHNQINDLRPLENLINLKYLYLSENKLTDISALKELKQLSMLELNDNDIKDVSTLVNLKELANLNIDNNLNLNLDSVEGLDVIHLSCNQDIETVVKAKQGRGEKIEVEFPAILKKMLDPNSKLYQAGLKISSSNTVTIDTKNKKAIIEIPDYSYIDSTKDMEYSLWLSAEYSSVNSPALSSKIKYRIELPYAKLTYRTHVQREGWQEWKNSGFTSGTSGKGLRLEGLEIKLDTQNLSGTIEYSAHVQKEGWQAWKKSGKTAGTLGKGLRLEAVKIRLTEELAKRYDIYYRVHAQQFGWLGWAKNGEEAGTSGYGYRLEAIEIRLVKKGDQAPTIYEGDVAFVNKNLKPSVVYSTHVQRVGWQKEMKDKEVAGTQGKGLRLEAIKINLKNSIGGTIRYRTHIQKLGWQDWKSAGQVSGTLGKGYRLEAINMYLTGRMQDKYDIYYRVHAQNFGWMGWAKNGQTAGTSGYGYRLEGIQIVLVNKGGKAPGSTLNTYKVKLK